MNSDVILLEAKDWGLFINQEGHGEAIQSFISKKNEHTVFRFQKDRRKDDEQDVEDEFAVFNYRDAKWYAGRYIGEAEFEFAKNKYKIIIRPRFGNDQIFRMLEEIYNIRIPKSNSNYGSNPKEQELLKRIISFLWQHLLSKANKHGLPKRNEVKYQKSATVIGRLDVRRSILPLYLENKIVSRFQLKVLDHTIAKILYLAYKRLTREYGLHENMLSDNSKFVIEHLKGFKNMDLHISQSEYQKLRYKDIYLSFKPVVDFSWQIINNKNIGEKNEKQKEGFSFFVDVAELWEMYLRKILLRRFSTAGWSLNRETIIIYDDKDYKRKIIPDIVLEKENEVQIWDAKYKRMKFDYFDYDRADFFQIHTYISYFDRTREVVAGGLLYPLSNEFNQEKQHRNFSNGLYAAENSVTSFVVDGIDYSNLSNESIIIEETKFLDRISNIVLNSKP